MEPLPETSSNETSSLFTDLYKYSAKNPQLSQQQRRERLLSQQKERRHQITDENRKILEFFEDQLSTSYEEIQSEEVTSKKQIKCKLKLMLSEWFTDIPDDLNENWIVKFAPEGVRVLLVAKKGYTICYNVKGKFYFKFRSNFPGGNRESLSGTTVLDCIYNRDTNTIFVLDCLFWNSMSTLDSEANFRFFWLKSKFNELPELRSAQKFKFVLLDFFPAERTLMQDIMFNQLEVDGRNFSYDGVVFYHKESHYTLGYTPLVGWLSSYMLPEMLHIDVSAENLLRKPDNYVCIQSYISDLSSRKRRNKKKTNRIEVAMDSL